MTVMPYAVARLVAQTDCDPPGISEVSSFYGPGAWAS
jgi:hypothetical protein